MRLKWTRLGLRTKLNLLTIALIVATAAGIAAYLVRQDLRDARAKLEAEGVAILSLLSEASEVPMHTANRAQLTQVLESLSLNRSVAYAVALDAQRNELVRRLFSVKELPALPKYPDETQIGRIQSTYVNADDKRILELFAPILGKRGASGETRSARPPGGFADHVAPQPLLAAWDRVRVALRLRRRSRRSDARKG